MLNFSLSHSDSVSSGCILFLAQLPHKQKYAELAAVNGLNPETASKLLLFAILDTLFSLMPPLFFFSTLSTFLRPKAQLLCWSLEPF